MSFVRRTAPVAVEGAPEEPMTDAVVEELRAIRVLLESRQEK